MLCRTARLVAGGEGISSRGSVHSIRFISRERVVLQDFMRLDACSAKDVVSHVSTDFAAVNSNWYAVVARTSKNMVAAGDAISPPSNVGERFEDVNRSAFTAGRGGRTCKRACRI